MAIDTGEDGAKSVIIKDVKIVAMTPGDFYRIVAVTVSLGLLIFIGAYTVVKIEALPLTTDNQHFLRDDMDSDFSDVAAACPIGTKPFTSLKKGSKTIVLCARVAN